MSKYVIDASVAIKWFLPEPDDDKARALLAGNHELLAPDLLYIEVANVLWKRYQRSELNLDEARSVLAGLKSIHMAVHPITPLIESALEIACQTGRTAYDSLYLALAVIENAVLVTADERLFNALASTPLAASVAILGDFSG